MTNETTPEPGPVRQANEWRLDDGRIIHLLTPRELRNLPGDARIIAINGEERSVVDPKQGPPDDDTRNGFTAWGTLPVQQKPEAAKSVFQQIWDETPSETPEQQIASLTAQVASLEKQNTKLRSELDPYAGEEMAVERLTSQVASLTKERDESIRLERERNETANVFLKQVRSLQADLAAARKELEELKGRVAKVQKLMDIAEAANDAQTDQEVACSASFQEAMAFGMVEIVEAERDSLRARLAQIRELAKSGGFATVRLNNIIALCDAVAEREGAK